MKNIILLRHADRIRKANEEFIEKLLPLNPDGRKESENRGTDLNNLGIKPTVYFTSCFVHAKQTGEILRDTMGGSPPAEVVELLTLAPRYQGPRAWLDRPEKERTEAAWLPVILEAIDHESQLKGYNLRNLNVVTFVLHVPRLQQLIRGMTAQTARPPFFDLESFDNFFGCSEGIHLTAASFDDLLRGRGEVMGYLPAELEEKAKKWVPLSA
ncbi:MAG: histidine phosphatase family protein [Verrucomicrobia bacterium]|nr:histidine phosphatase family protein [Verrucomicrobiota bacterium]